MTLAPKDPSEELTHKDECQAVLSGDGKLIWFKCVKGCKAK